MKRKLLLIFFLCLLLYPLSIGNAVEEFKLDGYEWAKKPMSWKVGFVVGWSEAGTLAYFMYTDIRTKLLMLGIPFAKANQTECQTILNGWKDLSIRYIPNMIKGISKEEGLEVFDLTPGQIVETIDKMYSDPRVRTWEVKDVMPLVRGRLKEGWTERDLDEVIAYLIREKEQLKNKKWENYDSLSESEKNKLEEEARSLVEPRVLKALRAYKFE